MFSLLAASTCLAQKQPHPLGCHPAGSWEAGEGICGHWGKGRLMMGSPSCGHGERTKNGTRIQRSQSFISVTS